ncbi:4-hydroxybenzoate 3-monooxygenase [Sphingomonas sp. TX0543]|uniref:4-hydroxybenzoate 3-monooxygenase n=1 Tax=unclassified Sphingomonas TaxID=196159 RepID=UPI0010F4E8BB|nr:4-hydroxybenzoate 3-monooxygenase [Sphingomonas sp. 3P27F8]
MRVDVAIVGAGPAGLMLGHLLAMEGVRVQLVERASAARVVERIRAGVLERTTTDLMARLGLDTRLKAEGIPHDSVALADGERLIRIPLTETVGHHVTVYGQTEVTRDLMEAAGSRGVAIDYEAEEVALHHIESDTPYLTYRVDGAPRRIDARFIVGCDGFHGPSRRAIPQAAQRIYEKVYPFGWLGILADVPPCSDDLIYANHDRGFALASMRSPTRSRYYIQVPADEPLSEWPDDRLWDELAVRLGPQAAAGLVRGPALEKSIAPLRSFVSEPMRHKSLMLAGDAAHIVPPTGAKGLNLAAADVSVCAEALVRYFKRGDNDGVGDYSRRALERVWKVERFSWQLTTLMHRFPDQTRFDRQMQLAELDYIAGSRAAQTAIAENYVGLPL